LGIFFFSKLWLSWDFFVAFRCIIVTGCPERKKRNGSPRLARPGFLGEGCPAPAIGMEGMKLGSGWPFCLLLCPPLPMEDSRCFLLGENICRRHI